MPNLKTDRVTGVARESAALNVRRLMYQSLIWSMHLRDHSRSMGTPFYTQQMQGTANALVHGVRRNPELNSDFLGG